MPDPGDLAAAYVTILPDMSEFVEDLAAKLEEAVSSMHPTVTVKAELDMAGVEAQLTEFTKQQFDVKLGADLSPLKHDLEAATAMLDIWASRPYTVKIEADTSGLAAALAEGTSASRVVQSPSQGGGERDGGGMTLPASVVAGATSATTEAALTDAITHINPAAATSGNFQQFMSRAISGSQTKVAASALQDYLGKTDSGTLSPDAISRELIANISAAHTIRAASGLASRQGLSTAVPSEAGGVGGEGPDGQASVQWILALSNQLKSFGSQVASSRLPAENLAPLKQTIADLSNDIAIGISKEAAQSIANDLAEAKIALNIAQIPFIKQGPEGGAGFFPEDAASLAPSPADLAKAQQGLASLVSQIARAKILADETRDSLLLDASVLNDILKNEPSAIRLATTVGDTAVLKGKLGSSVTDATLAAASGGDSGGGFFSGLAGLFGAGGDGGGGGSSAAGRDISSGLLGFGRGGGTGGLPFIGAVPWLAGMGSLGSLAGFGPEHLLTTGLGLAGSAVGGAIGGGLLGAGALGVTGVGFGTDLAGTAQAAKDAKSVYTATNAVTTAQFTSGFGSTQAAAAQTALNTALVGFSPIARTAVIQTAAMGTTLKNTFDQATGLAEKFGAQILTAGAKVVQAYMPVIGMFAAQNTKSILGDLTGPKGLFGFLQQSTPGGGLNVFTELEQKFQQGLPSAMGAFTNAAEIATKAMGFLSTYTGGFLKYLDGLFTKYNTVSGMDKIETEMGKMIGDFEAWKNLLKALVKDVADIFKQDQGLGVGIVQTLTTMLDKLHTYLTSTGGQQALHDLFTVHKQQVIDLLGLIPPLVRAFEPILHIMPTLTTLTLPFIAGLVDLLNLLERIPAGIGPAIAAFLGFSLLLGHLAGWGNMISFMGNTIGALVPALGKAVIGLTGFDLGLDATSVAAGALRVALGIGVLGVLAAFVYGLVELAHATNPAVAALVGLAAVAGVVGIAISRGFNFSVITGALKGLITWFTESGAAAAALAAEEEIAMEAAAAGVTGADAEIIAANERTGLSYLQLGAEAQAAAALQVRAAAEAATASIGEGLGVTAKGTILGAGGRAAGMDAAALEEDSAFAGTLGGEAAATRAFSTAIGAVSAALPVAIPLIVAGAAGIALWKTSSDAASGAVDKWLGGVTNMSTNSLPQAQAAVTALTDKLKHITSAPSGGGFGGFVNNTLGDSFGLTSSVGSFDAALKLFPALQAAQTKVTNFTDNLKYLEDHFHITAAAAAQFAAQFGIALGQRMDTNSTQFHQMADYIAQIAAQAGIATSALTFLSQQSGYTASQISNAMSTAANATQQLMSTFSNLPTGATALQGTITTAASTALSNSQQSAQLNQAITQAQQQLATDQASNAASIASAVAQAAQPGATPGGVAQAQASAASQIAQDQTAIQNAQTALTNFNQTLAATNAATAAALVTPPSTILQFYSTSLAQATKFNQDIGALMKAGFSPDVVNQIVTAGITAGLPTAEGLLQGAVQNTGGAFIQTVNNAANAMSLISTQAIEQARLMAVAVLPNTSLHKAMLEPVALQAFDAASANGPTAFADITGPNAQLDLSMSQIKQLASSAGESVKQTITDLESYGFKVVITAQGAASGVAGAVTNAMNSSSDAVNNYLQALSKVKTAAGAAAMGAPGYVPPGSKAPAGATPAASPPAGTPTPPVGGAAGFLGGAYLGTATQGGQAAGAAAAKAAGAAATKDGNAAAKPAGTALVQGIIDGVNANTPKLNAAILGSIKSAIQHDVSLVGGQSLGVALVNGFDQGISQKQSDANAAVLDVIKNAIKHDVPLVGGQSLGAALVNGFVQGINQNASKVAAAITSLQKQTGKDIGQNLMAGLASGINSGTYSVSIASTNAATKAVTSITGPLQIQSPSRVFYGIGVNAMEGFANGITAGLHKAVVPALEQASQTISKTFSPIGLKVRQEASSAGAITPWDQFVSSRTLNPGIKSFEPQSAPASSATLPTGTVVHYNPNYSISGGADASSVKQWKALMDQHDSELINNIYAKGGA